MSQSIGTRTIEIRGESQPKTATGYILPSLGFVIVVAVLLRVGSALIQGDRVELLPGVYDQISYHTLAVRVLGGHGFTFGQQWWPETRAGAPTAHWSFLYTLYLVLIYSLVGVHPLVARVIQAVVAGVLQPILTYRLGSRVLGRNVGLIAAALSSVYIYFFYYAGALMTETFYILAILWMVDLTISLGQNQQSPSFCNPVSWQPWVSLGLAIGIAALLRQLILLLVPVVFLWLLVVRGHRLPSVTKATLADRILPTISGLVISVGVIVLLIAPWTIRNYHAFGRFVLLNTNSGYVFFWGNNPIYGTNFVPILPSKEYQELIPANLKGLDEAALDQALMQRGIEFVISDPIRYLLLSLSRAKAYFEFWPSPDSSFLSNLSRTLSFGVLLPFMLVGIAQTLREMKIWGRQRRSSLILLYLFMLIYTAIHLLSWALIRYRLPVDALLVIFSAYVLDRLLQRLAWRTVGPSRWSDLKKLLRSHADRRSLPPVLSSPSHTQSDLSGN